MDSSFGKEGILSRLRLLDEDLDFVSAARASSNS